MHAAAAIAAMAADSAANRTCRNTIVVLITGGKDGGDAAYMAAHNAATTAIVVPVASPASGVTKRVPIVVIAVKPAAADEASLQAIATNSGGFYLSASTAFDVDRGSRPCGAAGFARSQPTFDAEHSRASSCRSARSSAPST